jgi:Na+-transporting methylmalonyl-CoA/oxaloacetate decarboxylase beta subunit
MKRVLAISNLIAASLFTLFLLIPLVLAHVAKPISNSEEEGMIIGGVDGPTTIFLSSEPSIPALIFVILMAGLLFWNAHTMWKER